MQIVMEDIFNGFVQKYETFQINQEKASAWRYTREILRHFDQLGFMLGFQTMYEKKFVRAKERKYDLIWYVDDENDPYLHVEHENGLTWKVLNDTVSKIDESVCDNIIAIMYPGNLELWQEVVDLLNKKQKSWGTGYNILVILDPYFIDNKHTLEGYFFREKKNTMVSATIRVNKDTGNFYAFFE